MQEHCAAVEAAPVLLEGRQVPQSVAQSLPQSVVVQRGLWAVLQWEAHHWGRRMQVVQVSAAEAGGLLLSSVVQLVSQWML